MLEQSDDSDDDEEIPTLLNLDLNLAPQDGTTQRVEKQISTTSIERDNDEDLPAVPVTVLTGFLGSGKTCLIQYILRSPNHKKKIAVIENEFSGISAASSSDDEASNNVLEREQQRQQGLSIETLIARDGSDNLNNLTDLIELPNGCICCTVKDSLVETLENLLSKKRELDYIIIECSGMANPGPIASIFWLDDALGSRIRLDGVVTCVDARNLEMQLRETNSSGSSHSFVNDNHMESSQGQGISKYDDSEGGDEAAQQIAFADRIIINKVDLLDQQSKQIVSVIDQIRQINATAPIRTTTFSQIPDLEWILDAKCFDVERAKDAEAAFSTITKDTDGVITVKQAQGCSEPMCLSCTRSNKTGDPVIEPSGFGGGQSIPLCTPCTTVQVQIPQPVNKHRHTSSICTVALIEKGSINLKQMHAWLASILWPDQDKDDSVLKAQLNKLEKLGKITTPELVEQRQKQLHSGKMQIFRIKGIVSVKHPMIDGNAVVDENDMTTSIDENGFDRQTYIVQAVNDLWEIHTASESLGWASDEPAQDRLCKLVVIGRYLDRAALSSGFTSCLAT